MQDRYTYDIGDFAKCGLLRSFAGRGLGLGVIWYFTRLGSRANDGRHVAYLDNPTRFAKCDNGLFGIFCRARAVRTVESFEKSAALPRGTVYMREEVPTARDRMAWFDRAASHVAGTDVVFCDPDNGIATERLEAARSRRHILRREIRDLWDQGHSLVIYHHFNRIGTHDEQIGRLMKQLSEFTAPRAVRVHCYSPRVFFVLGQRRDNGRLRAGLSEFEDPRWLNAGLELVRSPST